MNRTIWFVAGATTSVYVMHKARRAAEAFTPEGIRDRLAGLSLGAHLFTDEVKAEMANRENDLRERLGLTLHAVPELPASHPAIADDHPDSAPIREGNS
jgi:hypothetical protein